MIPKDQNIADFKQAAHQISRDLGDGSEKFKRQLRIVSTFAKENISDNLLIAPDAAFYKEQL